MPKQPYDFNRTIRFIDGPMNGHQQLSDGQYPAGGVYTFFRAAEKEKNEAGEKVGPDFETVQYKLGLEGETIVANYVEPLKRLGELQADMIKKADAQKAKSTAGAIA